MNEKIARFFAEQQPATPCLVVDLDIVEENFRSLTAALPDAKIYYAVKANPAPEILSLLNAKGSSFDTASVPEIELVNVDGGKHLWVGESQTTRVLNEIVGRINPAASPLPTTFED